MLAVAAAGLPCSTGNAAPTAAPTGARVQERPASSGGALLETRLVLSGYAEGGQFQQPRGVAFDPKDGAIYVANTGLHRIEVFSKAGRPLGRFVHRVVAPTGQVVDGYPAAMAFDRSGHLLVVDQLARYVDVLDRRGRSVARMNVPEGHPAAVAVGDDGAIYVGTNAEASTIHRFRRDYRPDGSWGVQGTAPGYLEDVAALAVMGDSAIAVACERTDLAIQLFTPVGRFLRGFGMHDIGDENLSMPSGMVTTADGRLWVVDEIRRTLQVYDGDGILLAKAGGSGTALGQFMHPSSLTSDGRGLIAVTDRGIGRVQVFGVGENLEGGSSGRH